MLYEELKHVFDKFLAHHITILIGDFNVKVGREDIFKPTRVCTKLIMIIELE
jgi:hypothetical protein